jgi:hypothetical protein
MMTGPRSPRIGAADLLADLSWRAQIVWITGNHDESLADSALPGVVEDELCVGGIALRHIAVPGVRSRNSRAISIRNCACRCAGASSPGPAPCGAETG